VTDADISGRRLILDGSAFEERIGYARAVVVGPWIHVSGTTGFNYDTLELADGVVDQAAQTLRNIDGVLDRAGAAREDIVSVRYIFADRDDFEPCWPLFREYFGPVRPAATMFVAELADPRVLVEIEVVACKNTGLAQSS
jgi:enamine deaminase RidA (YjgF/YER057c/UK114 family)